MNERSQLALIAEDDVAVRQMIAAHLRGLGLTVDEVGDGAQALDYLSQRSPALLCIDLSMPVISGYEVIRRVRAAEETHTLPILVITGRDSLDDRAAAMDLDVTAFISKPFKARHLVEAVQRALAAGAA